MTTQIKFFALLIFMSLLTVQCTQDDQDDHHQNSASVLITDAPIDDPNVEAVFVTITEVKIDGEPFEGFSGRQTIDIKALQNGQFESLGTGNIDAQSTSNVSFVIDLDQDDQGNAMGSYVLLANGTKQSLAAGATGTMEIMAKNTVDMMSEANASTNIVLDFDLRKAIQYNSTTSNYEFASSAQMASSVRAVLKEETGSVNGTINQSLSSQDKLIVYAYAKGTYNSAEQNTQANGNLQFSNAITSSEVDENGNFNLAFLAEGEYDLVTAAYNNNSQNQTELMGTLVTGTLLSGEILSSVSVNAQSNTTLSIDVFGIL